MFRRTLLGLFVAAVLLPLGAEAWARTYQPHPGIKLRELEKVPLGGPYSLYLVKNQDAPGTYAAAKGGQSLLIARQSGHKKTLLGTAQLLGNRRYESRQAIYRKGIRISQYEEKSVVAYLPSKDATSPYPRFYTVMGPKDGKGPLLIQRRPSRLVGGKPVEYSILGL